MSDTPATDFGRTRQTSIYISGLSGERPSVPVDVNRLRLEAKEVLAPDAYAYIEGGAGLERTMESNRSAFDRWQIVPRMLRDVSTKSTSTTIFGRRMASPMLTAPIGVMEMAHPDADRASARACASERVPMIFSNQASVPMEECAKILGTNARWFQLYWSKSNDLVKSLVQRAEACGCEAIVVTLDTTMLGWRVRDLDQAYLPFLRGKGIAQYTSDPVFRRMLRTASENTAKGEDVAGGRKINLSTLKVLVELMQNYPDDWTTKLTSGDPLAAVQQFINVYSRPSLTWDDLSFLRECTSLPIVLKGIQHHEDARLAHEHGIDGIVVSNHGGRQIDGAIGSFDALERITQTLSEIDSSMTVLFDSGIRSGADIFKAIAMGADAVLLGRPWVYGLALNGEQGMSEVLRNFKADFELTMGLAGCTSLEEITKDCLRKRPNG